jgi:hypothetical protein
MPKINHHPHPFADDACKRCRYWHPAYIMDAVILPDGRCIKTGEALANGVNLVTAITGKFSTCFRFPKWEMKGEDEYCGEYHEND